MGMTGIEERIAEVLGEHVRSDDGFCWKCRVRYNNAHLAAVVAQALQPSAAERIDHEVWVDHDYTPAPRNWEKCSQCGGVMELRHHCHLQSQLAVAEQKLAAIRSLANAWQDLWYRRAVLDILDSDDTQTCEHRNFHYGKCVDCKDSDDTPKGDCDIDGEWNPAVVDGDPTTQCTVRNGCRCLLGEGHQRDHRCAHGYWINLDSDDTPKEKQ